MKRYPKIVQSDKRGQIIIPQSIRKRLEIDEGSAFWITLEKDRIILDRVPNPHEKIKVRKK